MADFDDVLERLVVDPDFAAHLASDPSGALGGYHLSAEEVATLSTQFSQDTGGEHQVEPRVSKASLFGLLSSMRAGALITPQPVPAHGGVDQGAGVASPDPGVTSEGFGGAGQPGSDIGAHLGVDGGGHVGLDAANRAGFDSAHGAGFDSAHGAGFDSAHGAGFDSATHPGQDVDHDGS